MNICKIWDADYPWDIRVEKVVASLVDAGHRVHLVARNQSQNVPIEHNGRLTIRRLPVLTSGFPRLHTAYNFPFPLNPVWIATIHRTIRESHADLIMVRDLPLALTAALLGRVYRIPVVFDMAEHYPAMLEDRMRYTPTSAFGKIARHPGTAWIIERWVLKLVDHTIVVVEESGTRLMQAGYPGERITVVGNTPRAEEWDASESGGRPQSQLDTLQLVYLGNLDGIRGLDVAVQAVTILKRQRCQAKLTVIGDGPRLRSLRQLAEDNGVSDRVTFVGRLSLNDPSAMLRVKQIMGQSHIGLIPHYATEACNTTVPNKLFDYMVMRLPVIVSNMKPTERIVREERCGEVFKDRDPEDLARCIQKLTDPHVRNEMGERGREAIRRRYHWSYDAKVLVNTIETVVEQYQGGKR